MSYSVTWSVPRLNDDGYYIYWFEQAPAMSLADARFIAGGKSLDHGHANIAGPKGHVETWVGGKLHSTIYPPAAADGERGPTPEGVAGVHGPEPASSGLGATDQPD